MYCTRANIEEYILPGYLDSAEQEQVGIVDKHITQVTNEIDDALRSLYELPITTVPSTIKRICAVIAGYRILGSITSMVNSEATSNNEFFYIQDQWKVSMKELEKIREGKFPLGLKLLGAKPQSGSAFEVETIDADFDFTNY